MTMTRPNGLSPESPSAKRNLQVSHSPTTKPLSPCCQMEHRTVGFLIAVLYGIVSASMAFANKAVLTSYNFDYPFFLVTCQMIFAIVILECMRLTRRTSLQPFTIERGRSFLLPSLFYAVHSVLSLSALSGMNIPMYGVIKRCTPVVIMLMSTVLLKKGFPSPGIVVSVAMITIGCVIAGIGDLAFDPKAYMYGITSVFSQATYLILVQKYGSELGAGETLHINSYNTLPLLLFCSVALGDMQRAIMDFDVWDIGFVCTFTCVIAVGCLLNYLLFLCTTYNSALTTSITGSLKAIVQTLVGFFTFGGISVNVFTMMGIGMNLSGGIIYTLSKFKANERIKDIIKRIASSRSITSLTNGYANYNKEEVKDTFDEKLPKTESIPV